MAETTKVTDAFTYSNGDLETSSSSTWVDVRPVDAGSLAVSGNAVTNSNSGLQAAMHTGGSGWTAEQWAQATITEAQGDAAGRAGVIVRASGEDATANFYVALYNQAVPAVQFFKVNSGSFTPMGADLSVTYVDGDIIKLYAETSGGDTVLTVYKNGVSQGTRTDSPTTITGGSSDRTGVCASNASVLDDFSGGILTVLTGTEPLVGSASTGAQTAPGVNFTVPL
jgi:hypothetical protein